MLLYDDARAWRVFVCMQQRRDEGEEGEEMENGIPLEDLPPLPRPTPTQKHKHQPMKVNLSLPHAY